MSVFTRTAQTPLIQTLEAGGGGGGGGRGALGCYSEKKKKIGRP